LNSDTHEDTLLVQAGGINATGAIVYAKQNNCTFVNKTESIQTVGGIAALIVSVPNPFMVWAFG
jgi:hypothetical protein